MSFLKTRKFYVLLIAILGLFVSAELLYIYIQANYNPYALSSFCSLNDVIDCDGVEKSMLSQVFGIPFACWGLFLYSVIIFFVFVDKLKKIKLLGFLEVFKNPRMYIAAIGYIALILSLILATTAYIQIKKICLLCALTYVFDLSIGLIATDFSNGGIKKVFKTSVDDLIAGVKIPKYGISFAICVLVFAGFLTYTNYTFVFVPHLKIKREVNSFEKIIKNNPYKFTGNVFGDENALVTAEIFTDYECPICRINNAMLTKLVKEVKGVKIIHKNFPLDSKCNKLIEGTFHKNACMLARYSIAAEKQGNWGMMNDALFAKQPETEQEVLDIAKDLGFDTAKLAEDAKSVETSKIIQSDIQEALKIGMEGTPTLVIKGKKAVGLYPYRDLKKMFKDALDGKEVNVPKRK